MTQAVHEVVENWPGWKVGKGSARKYLADGRFIMIRERSNHMVVMLGDQGNGDRWNKFPKTREGAWSAFNQANFIAGLYGGWADVSP